MKIAAQQLACPHCGRMILTEVMNVLPSQIKRRESYCCWCKNDILFEYDDSEVRVLILKRYRTEEVNREMTGGTGVQYTTPIIYQEREGVFEVRAGIAIMGTTNNPASSGANPFDPYFRDNYVSGIGTTLEEAITKMEIDMESIVKGLWA